MANIVSIFKKWGEGGNSGYYRPVGLTPIPGKITELVLKKSIVKHLEKTKVIRNSHMPNHLIYFNEKVTNSVDRGTAVDVIYLHFSKVFDTVTYSILIKKLSNKMQPKVL